MHILWSGLQNSRFLGLCFHPRCHAQAIPLRKLLAPINARIFHLSSVVINLNDTPGDNEHSRERVPCGDVCPELIIASSTYGDDNDLWSGHSVFDIFVSSTSPFNIIALDRLKNLMNVAFIGNTEHFQVPAISSYLLSCQWTSNIVPVTISLHQFPEDVSISLPIVHAKVSALSLVTERVIPEFPGKYSM